MVAILIEMVADVRENVQFAYTLAFGQRECAKDEFECRSEHFIGGLFEPPSWLTLHPKIFPKIVGGGREPTTGTLSFFECRFSSGDTIKSLSYAKEFVLNFFHSQAVGTQKRRVQALLSGMNARKSHAIGGTFNCCDCLPRLNMNL